VRKAPETVKTTFQNPNGVTVAWIRNQSQTTVTWGSPEFHFRRVAATVGGMGEFQGFTPLAIHSRAVGTKTGRHPRREADSRIARCSPVETQSVLLEVTAFCSQIVFLILNLRHQRIPFPGCWTLKQAVILGPKGLGVLSFARPQSVGLGNLNCRPFGPEDGKTL